MKSGSFIWIILCSIAAIFLALTIGSARVESLTYDEIVHIEEGLNAWKRHTFDIDTNNPPLIRELAVIPLLLSSETKNAAQPNIRLFPSRMVIVGLTMLLGAGIFLTSSWFFGSVAASFALALMSVDPTILAYSHYITQDIGAALFFLLGYISLVQMLKKPSWKLFIWHGICMGLLASSKITLLPFYAVSASIVTFFILKKHVFLHILEHGGRIIVSIITCALVVWGTYFFTWNVVVVPTSREGRVSDAVLSYGKTHNNMVLVKGLYFLQYQKIPLGNYLAVIKNTAIRSLQPSPAFFFGKEYTYARWYFMVVNILVKTPIALVLLTLIGIWNGLSYKATRRETWILLIPILSMLFVSFISPLQPQIRYMLPLYPFMYMLAGLSFPPTWSLQRYFVLLLFGWSIISAFGQYPHFTSYANELAGNRETRYALFSDSNLDWGQSLPSLSIFIRDRKPQHVRFSYFGRDDASAYGFTSTLPFGSFKSNEICAFHDIAYPEYTGEPMTIISVSNWYGCGYTKQPQFAASRIQDVVADSFLMFK